MDGSIASAVVLPEQQESSPPAASPTNGHKRRQSSVSDYDGKRRRLSNDTDTAYRRESLANSIATESVPDRRRSSTNVDAKERTRGKRLFGAVLGALSQGSTTTAQKRRAEIEKKQQAKLKLQEQENDQKRKERLSLLKAQRKKEQRKFDKESMRIKHDNLLNMAHFLQTRSEPRLFYKPWELTQDEEDRIDDQITDAQAIIDRELDEFAAQQDEEDKQERKSAREEALNHDADASHPKTVGKESDADRYQARSPTNGNSNDSANILPKNQESHDDHAEATDVEAVSRGGTAPEPKENSAANQTTTAIDDGVRDAMDDNNGEEMMENEEDTVIY